MVEEDLFCHASALVLSQNLHSRSEMYILNFWNFRLTISGRFIILARAWRCYKYDILLRSRFFSLP